MKTIEYCITQTAHLRKNKNDKYIMPFLIGTKNEDQYYLIQCIDDFGNEINEFFQISNESYEFDCTEFMTTFNDNKTSKTIRYKLYSVKDDEDISSENKVFEARGLFTIN